MDFLAKAAHVSREKEFEKVTVESDTNYIVSYNILKVNFLDSKGNVVYVHETRKRNEFILFFFYCLCEPFTFFRIKVDKLTQYTDLNKYADLIIRNSNGLIPPRAKNDVIKNLQYLLKQRIEKGITGNSRLSYSFIIHSKFLFYICRK